MTNGQSQENALEECMDIKRFSTQVFQKQCLNNRAMKSPFVKCKQTKDNHYTNSNEYYLIIIDHSTFIK